ncbi:MAG: diguanylate cyclase [Spirochaetia bacterium]|nr:diguanylate cyclase [Spirochaetia bacterium]
MNSNSKKSKKTAKILDSTEIDILRWLYEGRTENEISILIHKSNTAVNYHFENIVKKLKVESIDDAIEWAQKSGKIKENNKKTLSETEEKHNVAIVGCGRGGSAILEMLKDNSIINIVGVADLNPMANGIFLAKRLKVPIYTKYRDLLTDDIELVIDVTGNRMVFEELKQIKSEKTEIMGGLAANLMWKLAEERRKRYEEKEKMLKEHENLYHLGLIIENIDSMKDAGFAIVDYATKLTNMPAGCLAIFDEKTEDLKLIASKGFTDKFRKKDRWSISKGGLINSVFNQSYPLYINDLNNYDKPAPKLLEEGVKSVLVSSLTVDGRIVGVIFACDFKIKKTRIEDISLFSLLTVYAALTIERVKAIEEMRRLSIVDGLTGLYNHRYLMEELNKEMLRSERYKLTFSILMIDVDNFKSYNDEFGHLEGNKILKEIADLLLKSARSTDTVGRFGGEEFLIIAPEVDKKEAVHYANRIITMIASHKFDNRKVTVSCGLSLYPKDSKNMLSLIKKADEYLYKAKAQGKNKVCCDE